jgi:transposase
MTHRNAPLTTVGRQRAVSQVIERGRPIAHVAAEFHIARATLSKWVSRYRELGVVGLEDRSSAPAHRPTRLEGWVVELIEHWRRKLKWSARRIARELADRHDVRCCVRTVTRWLDRLGLNRIRDITPDGENLRRPGTITARYPGHMIHIDVKKVGKIPDGGGWKVHGRDSDLGRASKRGEGPAGRLHLPPLGDRRVLPPGLHQAARGRDSSDDDRVPPSGVRVLRCARDHPDHAPGQRQRDELPLERFRQVDPREGRAVPADHRRRVPLRRGVHLRTGTPRPSRRLAPPLQLPSSPHRLRRSAPGLTPPRQRRQRHNQLQLVLTRPCD